MQAQAAQTRRNDTTPEGKAVDDSMKLWLGSNEAKIRRVWGPPMSSSKDGEGGQVFTYVHGYILPAIPSMNLSPRVLSSRRVFYIGRNGIVYDYNWQGIRWK